MSYGLDVTATVITMPAAYIGDLGMIGDILYRPYVRIGYQR